MKSHQLCLKTVFSLCMCLLNLNSLIYPCAFSRVTIQPCGFTGLVPEQFLHFQAHITASKGRISSPVGIGKHSSHHNILVLLGTQISIILKLGYQWNISSKTKGMQPLVAPKVNHLSSLNRYGKTVTNLFSDLLVFRGLVMSVKKRPITGIPRPNNSMFH